MTNKKFIAYWYDYRHKSTIYPVYEELKKRGVNIEGLEFRDYQLKDNPQICEKFYSADYIVTSSNCSLPYISKKAESIVWLWHGAGNVLTEEGYLMSKCQIYKRHKLNLLLGSIDYEYFSANMDNCEIVGYTKFDNIEDIKLFDNNKKTILFAGEIFKRDRDEAINLEVCKKVSEIAKLYDCNFIIKPYNYENYKPYDESLGYIVKEHTDVSKYIKISDVVISEFLGSPIYEAIGLGKQVLYFKHPQRTNELFYKDIEKINFGLEFKLDNAENLIRDTLKNPYLFEKERKKLKDKLFYKVDGKSTQRAVDAILRECV